MSDVALWAAIVVIGALTFTYRWSFIILLERLNVPPWLRAALRFVPIAALTAIITPELVIRAGALDLSLSNTRLIAGAVASFVAFRTRNVLATIAVGMATLWALNYVIG
jgi:branched-subunit amino acid transport protein